MAYSAVKIYIIGSYYKLACRKAKQIIIKLSCNLMLIVFIIHLLSGAISD